MIERRPILISGPTASGKSEFALRLAAHVDGVIVNTDSMQVYKELKILSGRPSETDEARVEHDLYGHVPMAEAYSVGRFLREMQSVLHKRREGTKPLFLVGGTGLYFKALLEGISPIPEVPSNIRNYWRSEAQRYGAEMLYNRLSECDPQTAARLCSSDIQRLVRALEVFEGTGRSLTDWQKEKSPPLLNPQDCIRLLLFPERGELYARCDARFDKMMLSGAQAEAEAILALALDPALPSMRALGLRPLIRHHQGEIGRNEAVFEAKAETRKYIKRQSTWIKGNMITWNILPKQQMERNEEEIMAFINSLP
ncbi:MAG: tRNA (adenosine(37)-N6)-dimethylallyltransferase MiaA [Hyphomicrobium sp.]